MPLYPCVKPVVNSILTLSQYPRSTQPFGLAAFSQQAFSSHSTPPSHCFAADCSHPLTVDVLSILSSPLQLLLDNYAISSVSPILKAIFYLFTFSVLRSLLFTRSQSIIFYHNYGAHTVIDMFCTRAPLIVHWVLHIANFMCYIKASVTLNCTLGLVGVVVLYVSLYFF